MIDTDDWAFWFPDADPAEQPTTPDPAPAPTKPRLTVSSRRVPTSNGGRDYRYIGVVKYDGRKLVECGHEHRNRDWTGATECARSIIQGARIPATAEHTANRLRDRWQTLAASSGHNYPASTIDAAKQEAEEAARSYLAAVDAVREVQP